MKSPIIEVKNLTAQYDDNIVLNDISFSICSGEIFMIIGGSGCGKTTLLNHLIGLLTPSLGEVFIDGENIVQANETQQRHILKKIGVLYQSGALFGSLNLLENVQLPLEELTELPKAAIKQIAQNKLQMVGLGNFGYYMPAQVSGGMQKRAALARAMALDPKILFLDEPTAGLDPVIAAELDKLIKNLAEILGITFVIVTHDLASINQIATQIILLHQGKIIAAGAPQELHNHANSLVRDFFNRERKG